MVEDIVSELVEYYDEDKSAEAVIPANTVLTYEMYNAYSKMIKHQPRKMKEKVEVLVDKLISLYEGSVEGGAKGGATTALMRTFVSKVFALDGFSCKSKVQDIVAKLEELNAQYKANESTDGKSDSSAVLIAYTSLAKHKPGIVEDFESLSIKLMKMHDNNTLHTLAGVLIDSFGDIRNQTDTITADKIKNEDNRELYNHHKRKYYNNSDSDLIGDIISRIERKAIFNHYQGNLDNHPRIIQDKAESHLAELTLLVEDLWNNNYDVLDVDRISWRICLVLSI